MLARERREPERHLREVDRDRIAIDAVQAALRDEPPRKRHLVLVAGDLGTVAVDVPPLHQHVAELSARFDEERA